MSEAFQLAHEPAGLRGLVGASLEIVATEFEVVDVVGEHPPDPTIIVCGTAKMALPSLFVPKRRENRLNCAAR